MKRFAAVLALSVLAIATVSGAATVYTRLLNLNVLGSTLLGTTTATNVITRSLYGTATIDFAAIAASANTTAGCEDSTAITVTGAKIGDACIVGAPATVADIDGGKNSRFECFVSAVDAVKVRHCVAGYMENPASSTFTVRVFSAQ